MENQNVVYIQNQAQRENECRQFLQLLINEGVRTYLEIGVQRGLTFMSAGLTMAPGATMVGVDMPGGPWGVKDGTGPDLIKAACLRLEDHGQKVDMIYGDSRSDEIIKKALAHAPFDLAFIDGDHAYEGVKADYENYGKHARIVVFHDIDIQSKPKIDEGRLLKYGVHVLWEEIKNTGVKYQEFIDRDQPGMGIGVLWRE